MHDHISAVYVFAALMNDAKLSVKGALNLTAANDTY